MNITWDPLPQAEWEIFHAARQGSLQQAWTYGAALASLDVVVHRAMVWEAGQLLAVAQFICRRIAGYISLASCTRGPVWHAEATPAQRAEAYRLMRQSMPLPRLKVLLFSPDRSLDQMDPAEIRAMSRVMTGYSTVLLDLTMPLPALRAGFEGKWRNRLSKALSNEQIRVQVQPSLKRCDWLLDKEIAQREAKKFHGLPTDFVKAYLASASDTRQAFAVAYAEQGKNTIGAMLFLVHGRVASYHVGWADEAGRQLNAHNVLLWQAMAYFQALGIEVLDLGGVNTHDLPGISRFKLGTGGRVVTLAGTYF